MRRVIIRAIIVYYNNYGYCQIVRDRISKQLAAYQNYRQDPPELALEAG